MRGSLFVAALTVPKKRRSLRVAALTCGLCFAATAARADEIRLKDGKKLYGVIVAYEDNMFKVKTDYGYVLVEKDKIASIVPSTPADETPKADKAPAAKKEPATSAEPKPEPAVASSAEGTATATNASAKSADLAAGKREKTAPRLRNAAVKPEVPANATDERGSARHHSARSSERAECRTERHRPRSPRRRKSRNHRRSAKKFKAICTRTTRTASKCTRRRAGR